MRNVIVILVIIILGTEGCKTVGEGLDLKSFPAQEQDFGLFTEEVDYNRYETLCYISSTGSDEEGEGTQEKPFATLQKGMDRMAETSQTEPRALLVAEGVYVNAIIQMQEYLDIYGGFDLITWERDIRSNKSVLSGGEKSRILLGADHSRVDGFFITGGRHRGNGGAVYCKGVSPEISNNYFVNNRTLEPKPWNPSFIHEKAHDGGAIYAVNGASPVIRNNIFARNETENGRGAAIALHGHCQGEIRHNLFLENTTGLNDQYRSSDGGAVSVFNWCDVDVTHNLFIGNRALTKNDGGALFFALWSSGEIRGNYFFNNHSMDDAGGLFVGGQEHRYDTPLDPLPSEDEFFVNIDANVFMGNRNPSQNSGALRITMESRGCFTNNLVAFNNGAYFQRSEVDIINNTIIDNLLLTETKEDLNPCRLINTVVLGEINIETEVDISNCLLLVRKQEEARFLYFQEDGTELHTLGTMVGDDRTETRIIIEGSYLRNSLKNRVLRAGNQFTLVKENQGNEIIVFDDLSSQRDFFILPTYTPLAGSPADNGGLQAQLEIDLYGNTRSGSGAHDIGAVEIN